MVDLVELPIVDNVGGNVVPFLLRIERQLVEVRTLTCEVESWLLQIKGSGGFWTKCFF